MTNKVTFFPFPYYTSNSGTINRGSFFDLPKYCNLHQHSFKCKDFYKNLDISKPRKCKCPYGFGVEIVRYGTNTVVFTCLNVEKISDRIKIQRRLTKNDFLPKLTLQEYDYIKNNSLILFQNSKEYIEDMNIKEMKENSYQEKIDSLNNTFHELRKLNKLLKSQVENLIYQSDHFSLSRNNIDKISYLAKNIFHSSQLITIRLNTYDFTVNPELSLQEEKCSMQIHKKFVKISYELREYANNKRIKINILGKSYGYIYGLDVFELLPYLLLDNAIKYSQQGRDIDIIFEETSETLRVTVKSFSLSPDNSELARLKLRGFRGNNSESIQGQGLGLYIADMICQFHDIDLNFKIGKEKYYDHSNNNLAYSEFRAILTFNNFEHGNADEEE